jgi:large conductance mechanosensitive channel
MIKEFRDFILRGNAIDLAVGVLIGGAFGKFVDAFTKGAIQPVIQFFGGDSEVDLKLGIFDLGLVASALISLLITGAVLFFIFVKPMNKLREMTLSPGEKDAKGPADPPEPSAEERLLAEIRDLLKRRAG